MKNNKKTVLALSALLAATSINSIAYADSEDNITTEVVVDSEDIVLEEDLLDVNIADEDNPASISNVSYPTEEGEDTDKIVEEMSNLDADELADSGTYDTLEDLFADNPELLEEDNNIIEEDLEEQPVDEEVIDQPIEEEVSDEGTILEDNNNTLVATEDEETVEQPVIDDNEVTDQPTEEEVSNDESILEDKENIEDTSYEEDNEIFNADNDSNDLTFDEIKDLDKGDYTDTFDYDNEDTDEEVTDLPIEEETSEDNTQSDIEDTTNKDNKNSSFKQHQQQMQNDGIKITNDDENDLTYEDIKDEFDEQKEKEIPSSYETWVKDSYVDKTNKEEDDINNLKEDKNNKELSKFDKHQKLMQEQGIKITKDDKRDLKWEDIVDKSLGEHEEWVEDEYVDKTKKPVTINEILDDEDEKNTLVAKNDNNSSQNQQKIKVPTVNKETEKIKVPYVGHNKSGNNNPQTGISSVAVSGILVASILGAKATKKREN